MQFHQRGRPCWCRGKSERVVLQKHDLVLGDLLDAVLQNAVRRGSRRSRRRSGGVRRTAPAAAPQPPQPLPQRRHAPPPPPPLSAPPYRRCPLSAACCPSRSCCCVYAAVPLRRPACPRLRQISSLPSGQASYSVTSTMVLKATAARSQSKPRPGTEKKSVLNGSRSCQGAGAPALRRNGRRTSARWQDDRC